MFKIITIYSIDVICGRLYNPMNGRVNFGSVAPGSKALYTCDRGYLLFGQSLHTCQVNGLWSGVTPVCKGKLILISSFNICSIEIWEIHVSTFTKQSCIIYSVVDCGSPSKLISGSVTFFSTIFGSTATYSCDHGYVMVGQSIHICQVDGNWSGRKPLCKSKSYER